ncbi:MAG: 2Fe-2S iron-sulfur cluster binding domain-containing protein [Treponema sp.]|nr:2Fe-2S iron-sulfur cluster binding domain-containing protein [Treponema sp.]
MKIPLTLNGKRTVLDADPSEPLSTVLRNEALFSVKCGCTKGFCGNCMVLLDGAPVSSCILPAGMVREATVTTLEYFKNDPLYTDIMNGFSKAGIQMCGYCNAGKIFTAYRALSSPYRPDVRRLSEAVEPLSCCCTDRDTLVNGILYAMAAKQAREGRKGNVKK